MAEPSRTRAIGLFDSGVGGLTVLREVMRQMPEWDTLYLADSANCPYGRRSTEEIRTLSEGISTYLISQGACCIVIACNTASAAALRHLRERFPETPFVGMVPAVKPAAVLTRSGTIGVLATPTTLSGQLLSEVVDRFATGTRVLKQECPGLVECIEACELDTPATEALLQGYLQPLLREGADVIVLGCTHYPFLATTIRRLVGPEVQVLDPSEAVARQVRRVLAGRMGTGAGTCEGTGDRGSGIEGRRPGVHTFCSTGSEQTLRAAARHLLGLDVAVETLLWHQGRLDRLSAG